jgi:gamma-glutamyltranspeptidase/glutathione hydrolase
MIRLGLSLVFLGTAIAVSPVVAQERPAARSGAKAAPRAADSWQASGRQGAVAAGGAEAVQAGLTTLERGGNAIDAAVATILALAVTDARSFCFGGEVPIMVYDAQREVVEVLSGQGTAPRLATRDYFAKKGGIPLKGVEAAAVPAALDACLTALDRYGTYTFAQAAAPALALLDRQAEPWHADLARTIRRLIAAEKISADRKRGLRLVADEFYRGSIAHEIDAWSQANGGLLRYGDLAGHVTRVEEPVSADYRGHTVYKCGPWTQGPALLQTLQLLEGFDLKAIGASRPETIHVSVEALKLALADRDRYYADPLFAEVPLAGLLAPSYAEGRRRLIDKAHASLALRPGDPRSGRPLLKEAKSHQGAGGQGQDTTTCVVADRWGNMVAATPSGWSGVVAGSTGVWLGSRLQSLNTWADHPNMIEPCKRPRITLTPTLILKEGRPVFALSVAGGDLQDQVMLQLIEQLVDFGHSPAQAVSAPRFSTGHHISSFGQASAKLGSLNVSAEVGEACVADLKARGHVIQVVKTPIAAPCALKIDSSTGQIEAAGDPKARRHAAAF